MHANIRECWWSNRLEAKLFKSSQDDDEIHEKSWWADLRTASELVMEAKKRWGFDRLDINLCSLAASFHLFFLVKRCCADYVNEVINNGIGKFLLFAHHRKMLDSLEAVLKERVGGGGYMRIDGSTPQRERADLVNRFQEEMGLGESHLDLLRVAVTWCHYSNALMDSLCPTNLTDYIVNLISTDQGADS